MLKKIKHYYQRATRGYSDQDLWSLDSYLAGWLPDALRQFKGAKQGTPAEFFSNKDHPWDPLPEGDHDRAVAEWHAVLDKMIQAFEAHNRIFDLDYDEDRDERIFEEGAALFIKHFGSLWT